MPKSHRTRININTIAVMCIVCCGLLVFSHNATAQTFRAGVILGMNLAQIDGDNYIGYEKFGLHVGATAELPLNKKTSIAFEMLYDQKGAYAAEPQNQYNMGGKYHFVINYVNVPILIQYFDKPFIGISAGPGIGRVVYEHENLVGNVKLYNTDISGIIDVRFFLDEHWVLNPRFSYSLLSIGQFGDNFYPNHNMYNKAITLRMLYMMGHRRTFK